MDAAEVRHWNADVNGVSIHVAERCFHLVY
jgi:hypothetical protein